MGKLDDMMRGAGANVGESMGEGRVVGTVHGATPSPFSGVPARLQGVIKAKDAAEIPTDMIQPDPDQPREEFDDDALHRLADSLRTRGQLQPIRVRWEEGRGAYVILCGERRWRAAVKAGIKTMSCVIHGGALDENERLAIQVVENALREDLRPIEQAKAYRSLMSHHGWSVRQVARELAIDHTGVSRALSLLDLPTSVQDQVERGELAPSVAYQVGKLDHGESAAIADQVVAGGLTREEAAELVAAVKARRPAKPTRPDPVTLDIGGVVVALRWKRGGEAITAASALRKAAKMLAERDERAA